MNVLSAKKGFLYIGGILLVVWLSIFCYIWFPDIIPDFLHLRTKGSLAKKLHGGAGSIEDTAKDKLSSSVNINPSSPDVVHVCITTSKNTVGGAIALINSIISNTKSPVMFHIVSDLDSMDQISIWIKETKLKSINYELKGFPAEMVAGKVKVRGGRQELASPMNYARYYLPQLFPKLRSRIIFIDDDCIVQGDISELYNMKIHPDHLAAFSSDCVGVGKHLSHMENNYANYIDFKHKAVVKMGIKPTECAFNTGVFVSDLSQWRKFNITKQLEAWLELNVKEEVYGNEKGGGGSQPPMMLVFHKLYSNINPMWNVRHLGLTPGSSYTTHFLQGGKLLHWSGRYKPWGRSAQHSELWEKYYIPDPTGHFQLIRRD
ncbi:glycosyltransferase 8 domain-containing protein 1-like isoform X1 [Haliotis rufescens]|uniref:glycosyltransferase 8 domain-containing protein 1-like isoform X1 n=1 Tax=Haliotis rufescens TaxID=6454 RepID=UPI00201EE20C|nr:glycosyltransferase 8 domain-containing protein 1-like isoform X1 [Haliotis rufescens]